jgi:hypothetical protein
MRRRKRTCLGFTRQEIKHICFVYDSKPETTDALQEKWPERPRWHFLRVAQKFGVSKPKPPRWTEQEVTVLVIKRHRFSPKEMAEHLGRSETAVRLKLKRLGYTWIRGVEGFFTARALGRIFGVESKTVAWWMDVGWLEGSRYPTRLGPYYPRKISWDAVIDFIEDEQHWHLWKVSRMIRGELRDYAEEARDGRGQFLTTGQVGKLLHYDHRWIRELIARGRIHGRKHGPNWKVQVEEVLRFAKADGQVKALENLGEA